MGPYLLSFGDSCELDFLYTILSIGMTSVTVGHDFEILLLRLICCAVSVSDAID